jgi:diphthine-ammonia ligase
VREELGLLLSTVENTLQSKGLTWGNVVYVRLFLEDMAFFGPANEVYVKHITEQKCERGVPSRCCMQMCLPEAGLGGVLVEVTAASDSSKQVLHVQSISCWAPSCIGPYSQVSYLENPSSFYF